MSVLYTFPVSEIHLLLFFKVFVVLKCTDLTRGCSCSYTVAMCGDGANDCGVSAGHLQLARRDPSIALGEM